MLAIQPPAQPTTEPVRMPYISGAELEQLAGRLYREFPQECKRIERALTVLERQDIRETSTMGSYLIQSSDEPNLYHLASSFSCTCPSAKHPQPGQEHCKHGWAVILLSTASGIARREFLDRRAQGRRLAAPVGVA